MVFRAWRPYSKQDLRAPLLAVMFLIILVGLIIDGGVLSGDLQL
jgi:hypothetical protein